MYVCMNENEWKYCGLRHKTYVHSYLEVQLADPYICWYAQVYTYENTCNVCARKYYLHLCVNAHNTRTRIAKCKCKIIQIIHKYFRDQRITRAHTLSRKQTNTHTCKHAHTHTHTHTHILNTHIFSRTHTQTPLQNTYIHFVNCTRVFSRTQTNILTYRTHTLFRVQIQLRTCSPMCIHMDSHLQNTHTYNFTTTKRCARIFSRTRTSTHTHVFWRIHTHTCTFPRTQAHIHVVTHTHIT